MRPMKPEDGWPIPHSSGSGGLIKLADSPGVNQSYYITGFTLSPGGDAEGFTILRRGSLIFDHSDETFTVSDAAELEPAEQDFAIVFGIKTSDHTLAAFLSKKSGSPMNGFNIEVLSSGLLKVTFGDGTSSVSITSNKKVNDGHWHQVIVNWEYQESTADGLSLYIDGESVADAEDNRSVSSVTGSSGNLVIVGSESKTFNISTLGLYKGQILSSAEIAALWNDGVGSKFTGSETGLSAAWNLDEGTGTSHVDLMATNNGTSANGTWLNGVGFPIDPHTLERTITYTTGSIVLYVDAAGNNYAGVIPIQVVTLPHAIKIGRNNPLFIEDSGGSFGLELYGYEDIY